MKSKVIEVLNTIYDPEIPVNIWELGFIYKLEVNENNDVYILMTLTAPNCPVAESLPMEVQTRVSMMHDRVSVRCSGRADFDVDDSDKRWIYDHNEVLRRLYPSYDTMAYFKLPIERMDYYDLRPTPPIHKSFDLSTGESRDGFVGARFSK